MSTLGTFFLVILAGFLIWWLFRYYKTNPQVFSKANLTKSFFSMGWLALILIAFVALLVVLARS